jgi:hypothetical protein
MAYFAFSFFFNPLVLLGIPLADRLDFKLVEEPTFRTTFFIPPGANVDEAVVASSSRF